VRISIITATWNRRDMLSRAIRSVMAQGLEEIEHIVVDKTSTDGTLEMLASFPHLTVISEPDRNLYEAWNKGIRRATGELIVILNSDDELPRGAFAAARAAIAASPHLEMLSGAVEIVRSVDGVPVSARLVENAAMLALREQDIGPGVPLTNGRYLSRRLLDRIGPFDQRYANCVGPAVPASRVAWARQEHGNLLPPLPLSCA
jgi:glycosyltransferase involved in cell wall biosynthesis